MYVPEQGMKETLRTIATESAPGSALLLEYINRDGLGWLTSTPPGWSGKPSIGASLSYLACPMAGQGVFSRLRRRILARIIREAPACVVLYDSFGENVLASVL
jgi:hypothetical protein